MIQSRGPRTMTLIVTAGTRHFVALVSDRRFTRPTGEIFGDDSNKTVVLQCEDRTLCFSYTGLGFVGAKRTDDWISDLLRDVGAARMVTAEALEATSEAAAKDFARLGYRTSDKRLTIALIGWPTVDGTKPIMGMLSNFEEFEELELPDTHSLPRQLPVQQSISSSVARPAFSVQTIECTDYSFISFFGRDSAVENPEERIEELSKFIANNPDSGAVIQELVTFIRQCAEHPTEGKYIGRNCMSVFLSGHGGAYAYHPEDASRPVHFSPIVVTRRFVIGEILSTTKKLSWPQILKWKREGKTAEPDFEDLDQ